MLFPERGRLCHCRHLWALAVAHPGDYAGSLDLSLELNCIPPLGHPASWAGLPVFGSSSCRRPWWDRPASHCVSKLCILFYNYIHLVSSILQSFSAQFPSCSFFFSPFLGISGTHLDLKVWLPSSCSFLCKHPPHKLSPILSWLNHLSASWESRIATLFLPGAPHTLPSSLTSGFSYASGSN